MKYLFILFLLLPLDAYAKTEREYTTEWCATMKGTAFVRLYEGGKFIGEVDCLTDTHAIEVEFAPKWNQASSQAMFYELKTRHKAGVAIIHDATEQRYIDRFLQTLEFSCLHNRIDVFYIVR